MHGRPHISLGAAPWLLRRRLLGGVLATIIRRVRDPKTGLIPLVTRYDCEERQWNAPAPVLFQYNRGGEPCTLSSQTIREILKKTVAFMRLTDAAGQPLTFTPQDFRRIFITDAIRTGLPPHIAVIAGHANINTTMGYNAVYPTETIEATVPSSPAAATCAPLRNTALPPTPSGRTSSATSNAARSLSAPARPWDRLYP
ncbi:MULTISPECIES: tyrosine-type recombinase/integrase [unclassified Streptomyces]|uniref:Site-specific integrase n=1 Tax=Streptomyces sp. NBC_00119 TaxID=2975659 RepID=A0AAU1ULG6_9ACTN|nr:MULTISPECIES: tyrosine-type recombinase/integrase [unclassified Streptomyces]MCX4649562.1 site-specific integrase [Streptomyces sp. NBC_01446]MCX5321232.1 site-specific integrase [Streptomyces sp. NBC_00120]